MNQLGFNKKIAESFAYPLWRRVSTDFKKKNSMKIWGFFENFLRSSARTESLSSVVGGFKKICPCDWTYKLEPEFQSILSGTESEQQKVLLSLQSDQLPIIVMMTKEINDLKKETK